MRTDRDLDPAVENFAAELTEAAYPVLLRHGAALNWLDMELELWRTMRQTVNKWEQEWPRAGVLLVSSSTNE